MKKNPNKITLRNRAGSLFLSLSLLMSVILPAMVMPSCSKNKSPSVTMRNDRFISSSRTVSPGAALSFKWIAEKGGDDLSSFSVRVNGDLIFGYPLENIPPDVYIDSAFIEAPVNGGSYAFAFTATDTEGKLGEADLVITVE